LITLRIQEEKPDSFFRQQEYRWTRQRIESLMTRHVTALLLAALLCLHAGPVLSRPYHGDAFTFTQPDGAKFQVRLYGDEYYAVIETPDGYTLTEDPDTGFYCYAIPSADGMSFLSTGYVPGVQLPPDLVLRKHARLAPEAVKQLGEAARRKFGVDDKGRLLPELRLRLRPQDFGHERWTPALEADALALASAPGSVPLAPPGSITVGTRIGLVLLARFPDRPGDVTISQAEVDAYANDPGYTGYGNATSVFGYFYIQSDGALSYNSIVTAYFTAAQPRGYYTDETQPYGNRTRELINEGLAVLKANGFDFTKADGNNDGVLDGVNIFYAGDAVNNWAKGLWPHKSSSSWAGLSGEGVSTVFQYQVTNMGASLSLGAYCHENGHMICGFPDLYTYGNGAADLNMYSLMAASGGNHPPALDPYLKIHAGWSSVIDVDSVDHQRGAVQVDRNTFYRYENPADSREYFLFSLRTGSGYEGAYGGSATPVNPTDGLVIWHAREHGSNTYSSIVSAANPATDYTTPYELMVVEANPSSPLIPWYDDPEPGMDDGYHAGDVSEASDVTTPALKFWDTSSGRTVNSGLHVHSISARGDAMTFIVGTGVLAGSPEIGITTPSLAPSCDYGTNASQQTFAVFNSGAGTLNYTVADDVGWLSVSPSSGAATTAADLVTVSYATDSLPAGTYNATITVSASGATNTPQFIPVTLTVNQQAAISLNTATLSDSLPAGASGAASFVIANSGGGTLSYTLSESASWLSLGTASGTVGTEEDEIAVYFDASGLFDGVYNTTISVTSSNAVNSPQTVDVTLTVSGYVAVLSPDGGEAVWQGNMHDRRWATDPTVTGNVRIDLYKGGVPSSVIVANTANDGLYTWNVASWQATGVDYRIRVTSVNDPAQSGESFADFSVESLPPLTVLPYAESFEAGPGKWIQPAYDHFNWTRHSGSTPSGGTGPTAAQDGAYYLYTESSSPNYPNKVAVLEASIDLRSTTDPMLSFSYHMYGAAMGTLEVEASTDQENWTTLFSRSGDQGNSWKTAVVDLSPFAGRVVALQVTGITGSSFTSDMAVDNFSIQGVASKPFPWNLFMPAVMKGLR